MDDTVSEKYRRAGTIAAAARVYGASLLKPGVSVLEVANNVESMILEKGADLAFPVNISIDEGAAHFSPRHDDTLILKRGDVVKLDVGAHIDGYIADTAKTVEIETDNYSTMIKASNDALEHAIHVLKEGVDLSEIGKVVEETIKSYGHKPITNLSGHSLERYKLHSGMSVPSVSATHSKAKPVEGDVLAIEPFATNGVGRVVSGKGSNIYLCNKSIRSKVIRDNRLKMLFNRLFIKFKTLPFAERWCEDLFPDGGELALKKLSFLGLIKHYPQLIEAKGGIVTQKEHTVIVKDDGCEVIT
ncbi:MAG: type II methionyl aminopeptidase [Thermoplasmatales archaeon]|nr:MAG: type II methionyl aminopeptidase [Thermoplasmatales archaeon]